MNIINCTVSVDKQKDVPSSYRHVESLDDAQNHFTDNEIVTMLNHHLKERDSVNNGRQHQKKVMAGFAKLVMQGKVTFDADGNPQIAE
jgi:hypothetical protein